MDNIGSYAVKEYLGGGAFGEVFKVTKNNKTFALKKVENTNEKAFQEVDILKMLDHKNITRFVDYFTSGGTLCIVMEFADRGTLTSFVNTFRYSGDLSNWTKRYGSELNTWSLLKDLSGALEYLHTFRPEHIMHRDLKPDNILGVSGGNDVCFQLADFGLSKLLNKTAEGLYYTKTCQGTPSYMAPEVHNGREYTFSADMWSLGAVMSFYCNLGKHLFLDLHVLARWSGNERSLPDYYSRELRSLVAKLLNPDYRSRPSAANVISECGRH